MTKIHVDILALETFGQVFGVKALITALDRALPEAAWQEHEELVRLAAEQSWEFEEFDTERQVLDEKSRHWVPRFAAYAVIALVHAVVEAQLFACAAELRSRSPQRAPAAKLKRRGLDRARQALKAASGFDVNADPAWPDLLRVEKLRNLVVHHAGTPESAEDSRRIGRLARETSGRVSLSDNSGCYQRHLLITPQYVAELAETAQAFFKRVLPAVGFADRGVSIRP